MKFFSFTPLLVLTLLLAAASRATAQTTNYQNRLVGQRAVGMGGAFTAIADDPSASFYNPAALSNLSTLQLEVGLPVVGLDLHRVFGGLVPAPAGPADVNALQVLALPTMIGAAAGVGPKDGTDREMFTAAVSLLIPWQRNVAWRQTVQTDPVSAFHILQENEQTLLIGGSLSLRVGPLSFGASLYYMHQNISWLNARSGTFSACNTDGCKLETAYNLSSVVEGWFGAINPRLGVLLNINEKFSVGVMASLSSFRVLGAGGIKTGLYSLGANGEAVQVTYSSDSLRFNRPLPWEMRFGFGYKPRAGTTLAIDATLYMPDNFKMIDGIDPQYSIYPADIHRQTIANANMGLEIYVRPTVPLRLGIFTNLTSAPAVKIDPKNPGQSSLLATAGCATRACTSWMHQGGVTASIGFTAWAVALDLGVNAAYARGYRQQVVASAPASYRWSESDQLLIQLFIGGNIGKVLGEGAIEIRNELQRRQGVEAETP
jgi:long-subunit fatty acid transport protein